MSEVSVDQLKEAVQHQLLCKAWFSQVVLVQETFRGQAVWMVHVFDLDYHGDITRAYAWSDELPGGKRRFFVVEHTGPVDWPAAAVRAAIVTEQRAGK